VDVSEESALSPGALIASRFLSRMPTAFVDERLARWTAALPTATRVFPEGDMLTVTAPHAAATPATAHLTNAAGQALWKGTGEPVDGASAVRFVVPLEGLDTPVCDLMIETSHGRSRTTIGIVSTQPARAREAVKSARGYARLPILPVTNRTMSTRRMSPPSPPPMAGPPM